MTSRLLRGDVKSRETEEEAAEGGAEKRMLSYVELPAAVAIRLTTARRDGGDDGNTRRRRRSRKGDSTGGGECDKLPNYMYVYFIVPSIRKKRINLK